MIENKKILCVVTARKGSKGLPGKNYRELMGKPLFMWSVEAGLKSKYVDEVIISSNCKECENIYIDFINDLLNRHDKDADRLGFIERPSEISGDFSKNEEALIHSLNDLEHNYDFRYDICINLQPTSPCRLDNLLDKTIEMYYNEGADSLLTATKCTPFLWQKKDGKWIFPIDKNGCCNRKMRQEIVDDDMNSGFLMHDNGCVYITDVNVMMENKCRIGKNPCIFETEGMNSLQIDEEHDFLLIENMAKVKGLKSLV